MQDLSISNSLLSWNRFISKGQCLKKMYSIIASPYLRAIFDLRAIFCKSLWGKQV